MAQEQLLRAVRQTPLMAVLRGVTAKEVVNLAQALQQEGVRFIEIPFTSPHAAECIRLLSQAMVAENVYIGGGTVLTPQQLDECLEAGGSYAVAPNTDPQIIRYARQKNCFFIPGFFTPSEAITAIQAGARMLKLFPAHAISPHYLRSIRTVLPRSVPIMVTGSLEVSQAKKFLQAECVLGLGGNIYRAGDELQSMIKKIIPYMKLITETSACKE